VWIADSRCVLWFGSAWLVVWRSQWCIGGWAQPVCARAALPNPTELSRVCSNSDTHVVCVPGLCFAFRLFQPTHTGVKYDPLNPNGHYRLQLADPWDHSIATMLHARARLRGAHWYHATIKRKPLPESQVRITCRCRSVHGFVCCASMCIRLFWATTWKERVPC